MSPPQAICFDMDGVLVQSEDYWVEKQRGHILPTAAPNDDIPLSATTGRSYKEVYPELAEEYEMAVSREEYEAMFERAGREIYREHATVLDGVHDLLADLRSAGVSLALTTSSPWEWIDVVDERFGLLEHFDAVVSADDIEGPGKPAPGIYERGAAELGVDPSEGWAVEDSTAGAQAAVAAGLTTVGFRGDGDETDLSVADYVVAGEPELRALLFDTEGSQHRSA
ncbi:HAD family hydrolase [Halomicroarcula sp. GCM10025324]|uniref:HAD family hydrolase n=1 Tax=Haloarcula TaxID=2237 RepID=UPI0023E88184|nr:HAD-IA family hydrolase [Halomicroarcula sp. ZS-22-S1]